MSEEGLGQKQSGRVGAVLVALTIGLAGVAWSGCGDDNGSSDTGEAQKSVEKGVEEAEKGIEKGKEEVEEGLGKAKEEAKQGIEKGKEEAEKGIEKGKEEAERYSP